MQANPVAVQVSNMREKAHAGWQSLAWYGDLSACFGDSGQRGIQ